MVGFGRLAAVEADRRQGASEVENYGRGPWQEGLRNSTLYVTLVALQYKYILARLLKQRPPSTSYTNTYTTERAACGDRRAANGDRTSCIWRPTEPHTP